MAQPGTLHVCLEEGTQATWLTEILTPHVAKLVVVHVTESRGPKTDERDAYALAEQLRAGQVGTPVDKHVGPFGALRQLVKVHASVVQDTVRTQTRAPLRLVRGDVPVTVLPDGRVLAELPPTALPFEVALRATVLYPSLRVCLAALRRGP